MSNNSLLSKLNKILDIKSKIKQAISNKNIDMANVLFNQYPEKINSIYQQDISQEENLYKSYFESNSLYEFEIPASVESIRSGAFSNDTNLESVIIGPNVSSIKSGAFMLDTNLKSIIIPSTVINIEQNAVASCEKVVIYCEVASKPDGWAENWNSGYPVVWNYKEK